MLKRHKFLRKCCIGVLLTPTQAQAQLPTLSTGESSSEELPWLLPARVWSEVRQTYPAAQADLASSQVPDAIVLDWPWISP